MIYNVQVLRAFAAILVLFVHLQSILGRAGYTERQLQFGNTGVDLFFVISGFIMVHTISKRPSSAKAFLANRVIRVVPIYWILTIFVFALALIAPRLFQSTHGNALELLKSLMFIPFTNSNGLDQPILFTGWTLNYEMFFYIIFAICIFLASKNVKWTVTLAVLSIFAIAFAGLAITAKPGLPYFYFYPIILEFAYGMIAAVIVNRIKWDITLAISLLAVGIMTLVIAPGTVGTSPRYFLAGLPALLIVTSAVRLERLGFRLENSFIQTMGASSYALYLIHPFVFQLCAKLTLLSKAPTLLQAALALIVAQLAAIAFHMTVERPLAAYLRSLVGHKESEVAAFETGSPNRTISGE